MSEISRTRRQSSLALSLASLGGQPGPAWGPNWIDHRSSLANVHRREDRGETVETCDECGCETDVQPAPHSPRCPEAADVDPAKAGQRS